MFQQLSANIKSFMSLLAAGCDDCFQLGIDPTTKNKCNNVCVGELTQVPFDIYGIQCISTYCSHSVIIKLGKVYAAGDDQDFIIGSDSRQVYEKFTEIKISDEHIIWAACGICYTLYLTLSGKVILCHKNDKGNRIIIPLKKKAVSVFSGYYGGIIDEEGAIHVLDKNDNHRAPTKYIIGTPAIDLVCCKNFICVLTSDYRVFGNGRLNNNLQEFAEVYSLKNQRITKLSGNWGTCAALTSDGRVYMYGENGKGQLGNGSSEDNYLSFTEVEINEKIKDVSCSLHTLLLTKSNKIFGCGWNFYCQLLHNTDWRITQFVIPIATINADQVITGIRCSFVLTGLGKLENPAKKVFYDISGREEMKEKIDLVMSISLYHSQQIKSLMEVCQNLQVINDTNTQKMQEIYEFQKVQSQNMIDLKEKIENISNKLDFATIPRSNQKQYD